MEITQKEQDAWHAGIAAGREIDRQNADAGLEPVAWQLHLPDGRVTLEKSFPAWADGGDGYAIRPLFAAPVAAQAQPEPLRYGHDRDDNYVTGWNDCVAALRSEQPVSGADGLLPCPFCGGRAHFSVADETVNVRCEGWNPGVCLGAGPNCYTKEEAAAGWNRRVQPAPVAAQPQPSGDALPGRDTSKPAEQQGLFQKFHVYRCDGSDKPGGRHHGCRYFVLDVDHDPYAKAALTAYAAACEATHPKLAADLREKWGALPSGNAGELPTELDDLKLAYASACEERDHLRAALAAQTGGQDATRQEAGSICEPINGGGWRVYRWNESMRLMLPEGSRIHRQNVFTNGTMVITIKSDAARAAAKERQ